MMAGIIWAVQCVQYPMFADVGEAEFNAYHDKHMRRITWVVGPLMLTEVFSGAALVLAPSRLSFIPLPGRLAGLLLLIYIWVITAVLQIPAHRALTQAFFAKRHRRLVRSNWHRTIAWTVRAVLVLSWIAHLL